MTSVISNQVAAQAPEQGRVQEINRDILRLETRFRHSKHQVVKRAVNNLLYLLITEKNHLNYPSYNFDQSEVKRIKKELNL